MADLTRFPAGKHTVYIIGGNPNSLYVKESLRVIHIFKDVESWEEVGRQLMSWDLNMWSAIDPEFEELEEFQDLTNFKTAMEAVEFVNCSGYFLEPCTFVIDTDPLFVWLANVRNFFGIGRVPSTKVVEKTINPSQVVYPTADGEPSY